MFAIYSIAVLSLTENECKELLGASRAPLLSRYVDATKKALSRARFMSTTSIVVLQALVLHILSIRADYHPRAVWSLTGVAIRIAEGMGMRLDGTELGLSPFESEMHRRIWWQLKLHDTRAAELCGQSKFRDFGVDGNAPKKPANVDDSDFYPGMTQAATESSQPTEMIWILLRADLASFATAQRAKSQKLGNGVASSEEFAALDDLKAKDGFIKQLEDTIETKHLRFCDPTQPLQFLALVGGRLSMNIVRFIAHHPRRWATMDKVPASEQQFVWGIAVKLLEQYEMMQSNPQLRRFAWQVPYFIQWHAVIHILDTLRADPTHKDALKAWRLIDALYVNNSEVLLSINRPITVAVGNLCLKAYNARTSALSKANLSLPNPPEYIGRLREQREAAKARREIAMLAKSTRPNINEERPTTSKADHSWQDTVLRSTEDVLIEARPSPNPTVSQPISEPVQAKMQTSDDAFWLEGGFLDDSVPAGDSMNIDTDSILAQGYWQNTPDDESIDWAQWDAMLGQLDTVHSDAGTGPH